MHLVVITPADGAGTMHADATAAIREALQGANFPASVAVLDSGDVLRVSALEFVSDQEARVPAKAAHGSDLM